MSHNFDVIIIGAGPAGSAAAFTAAEQGISVLLLEEHPKIGIPVVCGEGMTRGSIKDYFDIKPEWVAQDISGSLIRSPDGEDFKIEYPQCGWILNRKEFDPALAKMAEKRGAVVKTSAKAMGIDGNEVIVNESGEKRQYKFKFLIGADGIASRVGTWMGIDTRLRLNEVLVCAQYFVEGIHIDPHYINIIFGDEYAPGGYAWIFPKSDNSANIGVGICPLNTKLKAKYFLDNWMKKDFSEATIRAEAFGGAPAKILKQFSGKHFFLVGDAARFTDPLNGAGIANGIKSGVIAGRNAVLRIRDKKDYFEEEINKEFLDRLKFHSRVRKSYLKFTDRERKEFCKILKKIYDGKTIDNIDIRYLVREMVLSSPRLLRIAFGLLF